MFGMLLVLAAQSAIPDSWSLEMAAKRLDAAPIRTALRDYRVADDDGPTITSKDRAIAENGQRCAVIGAKRCTSKPRTIFRAPFN